jgi:hypothetical protein
LPSSRLRDRARRGLADPRREASGYRRRHRGKRRPPARSRRISLCRFIARLLLRAGAFDRSIDPAPADICQNDVHFLAAGRLELDPTGRSPACGMQPRRGVHSLPGPFRIVSIYSQRLSCEISVDERREILQRVPPGARREAQGGRYGGQASPVGPPAKSRGSDGRGPGGRTGGSAERGTITR